MPDARKVIAEGFGPASDYPFAGGLFDIYGMVFTIDGGNSVNFWSNGAVPGQGLNYGAAVTDGHHYRAAPTRKSAPLVSK